VGWDFFLQAERRKREGFKQGQRGKNESFAALQKKLCTENIKLGETGGDARERKRGREGKEG